MVYDVFCLFVCFWCWNSTAYAEVLFLLSHTLCPSGVSSASSLSISWNTGKTEKKRAEESYNEAECMGKGGKDAELFQMEGHRTQLRHSPNTATICFLASLTMPTRLSSLLFWHDLYPNRQNSKQQRMRQKMPMIQRS